MEYVTLAIGLVAILFVLDYFSLSRRVERVIKRGKKQLAETRKGLEKSESQRERLEKERLARMDVREIQFIKDGQAETKYVDADTYNGLMELMKDPQNGQTVRQILESL